MTLLVEAFDGFAVTVANSKNIRIGAIYDHVGSINRYDIKNNKVVSNKKLYEGVDAINVMLSPDGKK